MKNKVTTQQTTQSNSLILNYNDSKDIVYIRLVLEQELENELLYNNDSQEINILKNVIKQLSEVTK